MRAGTQFTLLRKATPTAWSRFHSPRYSIKVIEPYERSRDTRRSFNVQGEEYFKRHQNGEDDEEHSGEVSSVENVDLDPA
jgi:hypothetical protein